MVHFATKDDTGASSDKTKPKDNTTTSDHAQSVSQQALSPTDKSAATAGVNKGPTDKVPGGQVSSDGSITFQAQPQAKGDTRAPQQNAGETRTDQPGTIKTDAQGHVTDVALPNNQSRHFGYGKDGQLNSLTEPDGTTYQKGADGKWTGADGKPAPFDQPLVSNQGDLTYSTADSRIVTKYHDGTSQTINTKDNSVVTSDTQNRVTEVHYGNGTSRQFSYDGANTQPSKITETDGKVYTLKDGSYLGPDGNDTYNKNAKVLPDGTYSYQSPDGKTITTTTAGTTSTIGDGGSVARQDSHGRVAEIDYPSGQRRQFGYDDQGNVNKIVQPDGSTLNLQNGKWVDASGKDSGLSDVRLKPDGTLMYRNGDNVTVNNANGTQQQFDIKSIDKAAHDIHDAKDNSSWLVFSDPDVGKIKNIMEPMTSTQRELLAEEYKKQYGKDMLEDLHGKIDGHDYAKIESLMKRQDGVADNTGQIHEALAKLHDMGQPYPGWVDDDRVRAEKEVRDSINTLTADQLKAVEAKYKQDYGRDLQSDLLNNENMSDESKAALKVYFKGNDKITDDDRLQLADLALKQHRPDIFEEAFRDASQAARDKFKADGGFKKIDDAFDGGDKQIAKDYVERGNVSIATIVDGDTHWYHTNKDDIKRACENATDQDRKDFARGEQLSQSGQKAQNEDDQRALDYYNKVHKALGDAGNDRERAIWEADLRNHEGVIKNMLGAHDDGWGPFHWGDGTDKNKQLSAVENMSQSDWQYLKAHPEELNTIEKSLGTFGDNHKDEVMNMLRAKVAAPDFQSSQQVGNRPLEERLGDNKDNTGSRVDAIANMSARERQDYANNTNGFRDKVNGMLHGDEEKYLADQISKTQGQLTPTERVLIDGMKNDNAVSTFRDMEAAFKADPTLRDRMNNPQTEEDKKLSGWFHDATRNAVDKAGLGDQYYGEGGVVPGQYDEYNKAIFQNGHVPLDMQMQLTNDKQAKIDLILSASAEDKARLLNDHPDAETKKFQDAVFGDNKDLREVMSYALKQKDQQGNAGFADQADQFRLFVMNGGDSNALKDQLTSMTPEQRQNLANEYFTKYHRLITEDVIGKVDSSDQWRFRELLAPTDANVRQVALDAQMSNDSHTSSWDQFLKDNWDYTRVSADSSQDNLTKFVADHAKELDQLTPEQRKQFDDAVNNYMEAQKAYVASKGQFAEAFVDATITVAAVGGSLFTGGTSLALLGAIGAGGAIYRTAMMASIQGTDFDPSVGNVLKQSFEGGTAAALGFLGPEALGLKGLSVGNEIAGVTAAKLLEDGATASLFRAGSEDILKAGLADISRQGAIVGDKEIATLAERVAADGVDKNVVEQAIQQQLKRDTMSGLKNIVINESEAYARNMVAAQLGAQGKEVAATAAGFEDPNTLWDRMKGTAISTAAGVTFFHSIARIGTAGDYARINLGRDSQGNFYAGEGTVVRHGDGTLEVVDKGKTVKLGEGETIYEAAAYHPHQDGGYDLKLGDKTATYNKDGQLVQLADAKAGTKSDLSYVEDPNTHQPVLDKITATKADGSPDPNRTVLRNPDGAYRIEGDLGPPLGTQVKVTPEGDMVFTGSNIKPGQALTDAETNIGRPRWGNGSPDTATEKITVHADGSRDWEFKDGATRKFNVDDKPIETVTPKGTKSTYHYDQSGQLDKVNIGKDEYVRQSDGTWNDKNGKPFAKEMRVDGNGSIIIKPTEDFRMPNRPNDEVSQIIEFGDGITDVRYKNAVNATTDDAGAPKPRTAEEVLQDRVAKGDVVKTADDSFVHTDKITGARTVYDAKGEVVSVHNADGQDVKFTRDSQGQLQTVEYSRNGQLESTFTRTNHYWTETDAAGNQKGYLRDVQVDQDGSITKFRYDKDPSKDWMGTKERPDGTVVDLDQVGRESVKDTDLAHERARVQEFARSGLGDKSGRFEQWMQDFEAQAAKRQPPLSQQEIANTYYQLDKLMSTEGALLPQEARMQLAEQFMFKAAHPETIGQGAFNTCNVTAEVENRFMNQHPSEALRMVSDVATTGRYVTAQGDVVDMSVMKNMLTPFREAANGNAFNAQEYGGRDFFDQIVQSTSIETYWQTQSGNGVRPTSKVWQLRNGQDFQPGDLRYEFTNEPGQSRTGEVINNYSTNPPTREAAPNAVTMKDPLTGEERRVVEWLPADSPNLTGRQLADINEKLLGTPDAPHMIAKAGNDPTAIQVNSADELAGKLEQMQKDGGFPATVFVDSRDKLIMGTATDGGQGGAHVINVQRIYQKDGKWMVEFTNQWKSGNDHLGPERAVPVEDLWRAMDYRPPTKVALPEPQSNWQKYGVPFAIGAGGTAAAAGAGYEVWRIMQQNSSDNQNYYQPNEQPGGSQSTAPGPGR